MCGCLISITEDKETNLNMGTETIYKLIFERFEEDDKERSKSDSDVSYRVSPEIKTLEGS
jgi:hypothetical protein